MSYYSEEYEGRGHALISEVKFEEDPLPISSPAMNLQPEEQNLSDQHVTSIKTEYVGQSPDLTSDVKFEEDPVSIWLPELKREPEDDQSDSDGVNEEPRLEVTAKHEILTKRIAATSERTVSSEFDSNADDDNETVCEIPKNLVSSRLLVRTDQDDKPLGFEVSHSSNLQKHAHIHTDEGQFKCDVCVAALCTTSYRPQSGLTTVKQPTLSAH
ncbi:uncharacterized protein [Periplaneta americana]|uniref:uncharacterized protein isoform X7 n=1 Tax=Periplaneta americana TaxID=6978 RepID=UPI0037E766C9